MYSMSAHPSPRVAVIIPCHNEALTIGNLVREGLDMAVTKS
jgi:hypothetical protein